MDYKSTKFSVRRKYAGHLAFALIACLLMEQPVSNSANVIAQSAGEARCDDNDFPTIVCEWPIPVDGLQQSNFEVDDGSPGIKDFQVSRDENPRQPLSIVVVTQYGTQGLQSPTAMGEATNSILSQLPAPMLVSLVGISGTISAASESLDAPFKQIRDRYELANQVIEQFINKVVDQQPAGQLFDGLCKAQRLAANLPPDRRVILLLSDGRDGLGAFRSKSCSAEKTLQQKGIPIFAIGIGGNINEPYLQSLARQTGGRFALANSNVLQTAPQIAVEWLRPLTIQYRLQFKSSILTDGKAGHKLFLTVKGDGLPRSSQQLSYTANWPYEPSQPLLSFTDRNANEIHMAGALPFGIVDITSTLQIRDPLTVTYVFSDGLGFIERPLLDTRLLSADTPYLLYERVCAKQQSGLAYPQCPLYVTEIRVQPFKGIQPVWTRETIWQVWTSLVAVLRSNIVRVVSVVLLALALFAFVRLIRSRWHEVKQRLGGDAGNIGQIPNSEGQRGLYGEDIQDTFDNKTARGDDDITRPHDYDGESTMSRPLAYLKFEKGPLMGQSFPIGVSGREVFVGRAVDPNMGHIRILSDDKTISKKHARIYVENGHLYLQQKSEINPTRVNNNRPLEHDQSEEIKPNDTVHFYNVSAMVTKSEE